MTATRSSSSSSNPVLAAAGADMAMRLGLHSALGAVAADVAALISDGKVVASFSGGDGETYDLADVLEVASGRCRGVRHAGGVWPHTAVARTAWHSGDVALVVARDGKAFSGDCQLLLDGMVEMVAFAVAKARSEHDLRMETESQAAENEALLRSLEDRQSLFASLAGIARLITRRIPSDDILHEITHQARERLAAEVVLLVRADAEGQRPGRIVSVAGRVDADWRAWRLPMHGVLPLALRADGVVVDPAAHALRFLLATPDADLPGWASSIQTVMATPVHEDGEVAGVLLVGFGAGRRAVADSGDEVLLAYAEQASIVLTDARTNAEIQRALRDPLTGLYSRGLFLEHVEESLEQKDAESLLGVLFIDLDGFKAVNDTLGHAAGDEVLAGVARRLRQCVRASDVIGRIGGDEFSLVVPGATHEILAMLAQRIVAAMREPFPLNGRDVYIGASVGIASTAEATMDAEELLRHADVAMYRAKTERRGQVVFSDDMQEELLATLQAESDLRAAIAGDEFVLFFQPVISLSDRSLIGFEALIRWDHPQRGHLAPIDFIPLAEQTGLIVDIDRWVIRHACAQAGAWKREHGLELMLSINISGHGIAHEAIFPDLVHALQINDLTPSSVTIELTETVLLKDLEAVARATAQLKALGVRTAVDDFGTGYSSLSYLHQLSFDVLKVDRSFVSGVGSDLVKSALVRGVIGLGLELELEVVAEGIESQGQLDGLAASGCHSGQGYFIDKPMEATNAATLIQAAAVAKRPASAS